MRQLLGQGRAPCAVLKSLSRRPTSVVDSACTSMSTTILMGTRMITAAWDTCTTTIITSTIITIIMIIIITSGNSLRTLRQR